MVVGGVASREGADDMAGGRRTAGGGGESRASTGE